MENEQVEKLYKQLLDSWNNQNATKYASFFSENGSVVGFDGSQMNGKDDIESEIGGIFVDHQTAKYVSKVREIRFLRPDVALLRAVAGMIPPGEQKVNPAANAIQSLVLVKENSTWSISHFHNTPAQFHGRPGLVESLTQELQEVAPGS